MSERIRLCMLAWYANADEPDCSCHDEYNIMRPERCANVEEPDCFCHDEYNIMRPERCANAKR